MANLMIMINIIINHGGHGHILNRYAVNF